MRRANRKIARVHGGQRERGGTLAGTILRSGEFCYESALARAPTEERSMTKEILAGAVVIALAFTTAACSTRTGTGAAAGAATGAVVGGPVGAVVGAGAGAAVGAVSEETTPPRE